jgi:DNA repair photolyase
MPHVISASRRTDIPAFYSDWFLNRLRAGHVFVKNPYSQKFSRVSLSPEDVSAVVFWSKNYSPLLSRLDPIEQFTKDLFFHFTITANRDMESTVPDCRDTIKDYLFLARRYSPEQVIWRFDPICITDKQTFEDHEERFMRCAELLRGHARECIISFVHPYKKVLASLKKNTDRIMPELSREKKREYALRLAQRAAQYGIRILSCCNDYLLSKEIQKASCIDGRQLSNIFSTPIDTRPAATRKECGCTKSIDIGAYDTCAHGCLYCYANADPERGKSAYLRHDPAWNALGMNVERDNFETLMHLGPYGVRL